MLRIPGNSILFLATAVVAVLLVGLAGGMVLETSVHGVPSQPLPAAVDVGFAQDMTVHHRQAVTMGGWARDRSTDVAVRQLAFDVERSQTEQIGRMQSWLAIWDKPAQAIGPYMTWMAEADHAHGGASPAGVAAMPGMATDDELSRLRSLTGKELDVYFLQLMLRHHGGGAPMAEYAGSRTNLPAVRALARSIVASQTDEMGVIRHMLVQRGARPW